MPSTFQISHQQFKLELDAELKAAGAAETCIGVSHNGRIAFNHNWVVLADDTQEWAGRGNPVGSVSAKALTAIASARAAHVPAARPPRLDPTMALVALSKKHNGVLLSAAEEACLDLWAGL